MEKTLNLMLNITPQEAAERLEAQIEQRAIAPFSGKPVRGQVKDESFWMKKRGGRNSLRPKLKGELSEASGGAKLSASIQTNELGKNFGRVWFIFAASMALLVIGAGLLGTFTAETLFILGCAIGVPLFGAFILGAIVNAANAEAVFLEELIEKTFQDVKITETSEAKVSSARRVNAQVGARSGLA